MALLYELESQTVPWKWTDVEQQAFKDAKDLLRFNSFLAFYDASKMLYVTTDASSYGIAAVLEQEQDGQLRPLSYASRTMNRAEKNYMQTEKEGLSIVWAVSKFNKYMYGRKFEIWSDHRALLGLLGEKKPIPTMASGRIVRWALTLSGYDYVLKYKPGCQIPNADCLLRLTNDSNDQSVPDVGEHMLLIECLEATSKTAEDIQRRTDRDPVLAKVRSQVMKGWIVTWRGVLTNV